MRSIPINPLNILSFTGNLTPDELREWDHEDLLKARELLKDLKRRVDRTLLTLSFLDASSLN